MMQTKIAHYTKETKAMVQVKQKSLRSEILYLHTHINPTELTLGIIC